MKNITIYQQPGRYAGWPANYGIWSWGDEIVVGFTLGYADEQGGFHARDRCRPFVAMQARSLDGGESWQVEETPCHTPGDRGILSADEHVIHDLSAAQAIDAGLAHAPLPCPGGINFAHPDFALMCARTGLGAGTVSWFYTSTDRCRSWDGPFSLPTFGQPGIEARTDYIVDDANTCTLFLSAAREDGGEGAGVFCARTHDGGRSFELISWVTQAESGYVIMPSSVRLSADRLVCAVRCREGNVPHEQARCWIDLYSSEDNGESWQHLAQPVENTGRGGNPPSLIRLADGRLCLIYGYRAKPFGMRARLSSDGGQTWGDEIILRDDAGSHDLGYPRSVQRDDGSVVTVYYYNDRPGGEGYVAATIWTP
jgi:hypothetical protein